MPGNFPVVGQMFTALTASSLGGTQFDAVAGEGPCASYDVTYGPGSVVVTVLALPIPGDINADGFVNVLDLIELLLDFGAAGGPSDINGDGFVNVLDLIELLLNFGQSCP